MSAPEPSLADFLRQNGLAPADDDGVWTPLSGGVSSDIWRVRAAGRDICVKRARAVLKTAAEWRVPVDRNAFEWEYTVIADRIAPGHVPKPLAQDPARGLFAMSWLEPASHPVWKTRLLAGDVDPSDAAEVGSLIGRIHAATAGDDGVRAAFATDDNFRAIRLDPYLLATAEKHPDLAPRLRAVAAVTAATKHALVHGDVSPKNILLGPDGPVLLDAECAWWGDPAFDLAFCLNHLVIKARVVGSARPALSASFDRLASAYLSRVAWEAPDALERRAAALLPCLALARVDGKSPLEYLDDAQGDALRRASGRAVAQAPTSLGEAKAALLS